MNEVNSKIQSLESVVGISVTSQGWGKDDSKDVDMKLTEIDVAVRSQAYCNYVLNKTKHEGNKRVFLQIETFLPELLKESQFCADKTILTDEEKVTNGDSGGPSVRR